MVVCRGGGAGKELVHVFWHWKKEGDAGADFNHHGVGKPFHPGAQPFFCPWYAGFLLKGGENRQKKTACRHGGHHTMPVAGEEGGFAQVQEGAIGLWK